MNILVLAPHADDEAFGCGGMIAKSVAQGHSVSVVIAAMGYGDTYTRKHELSESARVLGIEEPRVLDNSHESFLDTVPQHELVGKIDSILSDGYDHVYIPYAHHHQDHRALFDACFSALRITGKHDPSLIAMYENVFHGWTTFSSWNGKMYVDITHFIKQKTGAVSCYTSQIKWRSDRSPVSVDAVRSLARERGMECGREYAEMYYILRDIR
jgi:LmbE family N-acetylglucosaminyl deacetylase